MTPRSRQPGQTLVLFALSIIGIVALVGLVVGLFYNQRLQTANASLEVAVETAQQQKGEADSQRRRAEGSP